MRRTRSFSVEFTVQSDSLRRYENAREDGYTIVRSVGMGLWLPVGRCFHSVMQQLKHHCTPEYVVGLYTRHLPPSIPGSRVTALLYPLYSRMEDRSSTSRAVTDRGAVDQVGPGLVQRRFDVEMIVVANGQFASRSDLPPSRQNMHRPMQTKLTRTSRYRRAVPYIPFCPPASSLLFDPSSSPGSIELDSLATASTHGLKYTNTHL